jgi:proline iminopeptidase
VARTLVLVAFALVAWGLCGATIGVARGLMPMESALIVHAVAAPIIAGSLAYVYARWLAGPRPLAIGAAFLGAVVVMDVGLIAPFVERSWEMFRSPIGTWIPFALIFLVSWGVALWVLGPGPEWRWHATPDERRRTLPGDALCPEAPDVKTHAITVEASPEALWPWLVQMGCDRAGWYSWDRLDNAGHPSADSIRPELQATKVGDLLPSRPGHEDGFLVLELEESKHLALGAYFRYFPGLAGLEWTEPPPKAFTRATWTFVLEALESERTRLLVRTRGLTRPWWLDVPMRLTMGPAHAIMQRKQLLNLKARAEKNSPSS